MEHLLIINKLNIRNDLHQTIKDFFLKTRKCFFLQTHLKHCIIIILRYPYCIQFKLKKKKFVILAYNQFFFFNIIMCQYLDF